jgi:uncharacterized protein (DUF362 family)/NAD-dependent dihydropyrimidine dehydrogenase PreA subunit
MQMTATVSVVRCVDYDAQETRRAVREALYLVGLESAFRRGETVLLKPNLLSARSPGQAVTTHPSVVKAVGEIAKDAGCRLMIGDSPPLGGADSSRYDRLCRVTGIFEVATHLGAELVRFEERSAAVVNAGGRYYKNFEVGSAILEADLVVNIPKLKTHGLTIMSGAIKNLFGCVPGVRKGLFHAQAGENRETFAQTLVDLLGVFPNVIHLMDAVVAMEGEGPNAGIPRAVGAIIASPDPVAMDAVCAAILGIQPSDVHTTRLAHAAGLGCGELDKIEVIGESISGVSVKGFRLSSGENAWTRIPSPIRRLLRRHLIAIPRVMCGCVGCGECVDVCPVGAMTPGRPVVVDLDKCIRCYCCHEVCPYNQIELRRGFLGEFLMLMDSKK